MTAAAMLIWVACSGPGKETGDGTGHDDTGGPPIDTAPEIIDDSGIVIDDSGEDTEEPDTGWGTDAEIRAAFFDTLEVQRIDLTLSADALAALREDPVSYVECTFVHDDHILEQVGIKLSGGASTFEDLDGKPNFRLKLDEFDDHQDYGGIDKINLHNMAEDDSQSREVVASAVWNAAGMPVPIVNYAEVYVNGELYGLYANVEEMDQGFLEAHGLDPDGDLWEAQDSADLTPGGINHFDSAAGEGDEEALDEARRQVQLGDGAFYDAAGVVLDMDQFLDFWAWQAVVGNPDGYPYELDDFYLYANPAVGGRYQFFPWSMDETWDTDLEWDAVTGTVAVQCYYDDACQALFLEHLSAGLTTYESLGAAAMAEDAFTLSTDAVNADPRRTTSITDVLTARTTLSSRMLNWPNQLRAQVGM